MRVICFEEICRNVVHHCALGSYYYLSLKTAGFIHLLKMKFVQLTYQTGVRFVLPKEAEKLSQVIYFLFILACFILFLLILKMLQHSSVVQHCTATWLQLNAIR